jgi:hypothetical protein
VSAGNYVTIFANLNHIPELSPQHTSIYVQQHTQICLFIYMAVRTLQSAQQLGIGLDNQGSRFNAWQGQGLFSKAPRLAPGSGPVQPPTQWVSGPFLQGKRCQNMKLTTHHPHSQPHLQPPKVELYHNPCHAFMACTQLQSIFTSYFHSIT